MKKRAIIWIVVIIILALVILVFLGGKESIKTGKECNADSDCVKVQTSCCPCNSGGEEKCVPKNEAENYKLNCSKEIFCAQVYNCKIEKCSCEEGKCQG